MLTQNLREKLMQNLRDDPKAAVKEIEQNPKILNFLLSSELQLEQERSEKVKYINMTQQMESQLQEEAKKLKTTQGLLIGAGLLLLLSLLKKR